MAASVPKRINLLVQEGFENTPLGKVLNWLLSAGRIIVVLTQLVVIAAFLSRFWFDRQLTDLADRNNQLKTQIEARTSFESGFRDLQERLSAYGKVYGERTIASSVITDIAQALPSDVFLSNVSITERTLVLQGSALSERGLAGFIKALGSEKEFENPVLTEVSLDSGGQQTIRFSIRTNLISKERGL